MGSSSDMKLQLVIDAMNRSEAALNKLKKDLFDVEAGTTAVTTASNRASQAMSTAGNAGAASMSKIGPAVAIARDHVAAAQKELPGLLQRIREMQDSYAAINGIAAANGKALEDAGARGAHAMDQVHDHAQRAHSMLGQMVQMAIIMATVLGAKALADAGMEYNKALETSKLGISAIMTSMGVISDQQGRVLQGQEKWHAAQQLSVEAQRELQKIAMDTPATFEELVQAYQGLEAPALGAKMTFQETLQITGLLTNSVKSMGLPLNQIVQEGRDMVSATIDQNSQLARSLQITNEDVKKWREKGTVFQEIEKRLEGFKMASKEFGETWEGAWSNFKDIGQRALGEGSKPLFDHIKKEILKLSADMTNITKDADGNIIDIQVKPEVVARIRELAEDLKKLIQFLELAVSWGSKLAQPLIWGGIALGIGKIALAIEGMYKTIAAGETVAAGSVLMRLLKNPTALAAVVAIAGTAWTANRAYDNTQLSGRADDVRAKFKPEEAEKLNLSQLKAAQMREVLEKFPAASNDDIAKLIRGGGVRLSAPSFSDRYSAPSYKVQINDKLSNQLLDPGKAPFDLKGPNNKTPAEIKKEREAFIAAMEDSYAESAGKFRVGEAKEAEAIKIGLKEKELAWQQGLITEGEYLQARADLEAQALSDRLKSISDQQIALTAKYQEEASKITDPKEASEKHKAYVTAWYALEVDYQKVLGDKKRAGFEEELKQAAARKQLADAQREGALKLLQEQLNGEKQLTQLLLEREKITPYQAEQRNISTEQSGLEAEYWNVFAKKKIGGLTSAQIADLDAQLTVLEERMNNLAQAVPDRLYRAGQSTAALEAKRAEARVSHELAALDEQEKMREVGKAEAIRKRIDLTNELLESQLKVQAGIDPHDTTAWNSQQSAIDATRQKLLELKLAMRDLSDNMAGGLREGIAQYVDSLGGPFQKMETLARSTAQAMEQGFSDFFFDVMTGKIDDLGKALESMLNSIQRSIANVLAQMATEGLLKGLGFTIHTSTSPGATPAGGSGMGGVDTFAMAHQGGLILHDGGKVVPRFHFGGLASNEVPAVLLKRERVLSIEQNQLFEKFVNKTEGPAGLNVAVNVENRSSQEVTARTGNLQFDGKRYIVDVVLEDIYNGGDLYHAVGGRRG